MSIQYLKERVCNLQTPPWGPSANKSPKNRSCYRFRDKKGFMESSGSFSLISSACAGR